MVWIQKTAAVAKNIIYNEITSITSAIIGVTVADREIFPAGRVGEAIYRRFSRRRYGSNFNNITVKTRKNGAYRLTDFPGLLYLTRQRYRFSFKLAYFVYGFFIFIFN